MEFRIRKWYILFYMISATIGTISNAFLYTLSRAFDRPFSEWFPFITNPIFLVLGAIAGVSLLQFGRRKVLISANIMLVITSVCSAFRFTPLIFVAIPLLSLFFSFNYLLVLLFCKEIPPFRSNGIPIILLNAFEYLGYSGCLGALYLFTSVYGIDPLTEENLHIRLLLVAAGSAPVVVQTFLLTFVYIHEPPGYSVEQCSEEDAAASLAQVYSDTKELVEVLAALRQKADYQKYTGAGWSMAITKTPKRISAFVNTIMLLFLNFVSGYYSYALPTRFLETQYIRIHMMSSLFAFACLVILFGSFINSVSIRGLLLVGSIAGAFVNVICTILFTYCLYYNGSVLALCLLGSLGSAIHMTFIVIPTYKFAVTHLVDKSLLIAVVVQFLGYIFYAWPISLSPKEMLKEVAYGLQIGYTLLSFFLVFFVIKYIMGFYKEHFETKGVSVFEIESEDTQKESFIG